VDALLVEGCQFGPADRDCAPCGSDAPPPPAPQSTDGKTLSFDELYDQHVDLVWRTLRGLGVPESSVEDALQDVFLVVYRRVATFEYRSKLSTWVFRIALNVARDYRRRARRRETVPLEIDVVDARPGPHEAAASAQALRNLASLLDALDETKRATFIMSEVEGMSAPEIAEVLGVNVNTVYARIRVARREFELVVEQRGQGGER
jgi:RNA polymerase sigma-70 factor, ECF subfamily